MKPAYPAREFILRVLYFCLGTAVCALGCSAFVLSGIGTDPFSMLMQGVARTAHISNGTAHIAINFTLLVLYFFIDRKYIRAGTFAALFITGPMIDAASRLLRGVIHEGLPFPVRVVIVLASCALIALGLSASINASVGVGANDSLAILLSDKLHLQFRWMRVAVDLTFVVSGFLLGGVIGVGTVITALLTGPIVQFFMPRTARLLYSILRRLTPQAESA